MENFCGPAEGFTECGSACGHDHEFLCINRVGSVRAAVQDVHHGNRKRCSLGTAEETIKRNAFCRCRCFRCRNGNSQDRVRAQLILVGCAVKIKHDLIYQISIRSVYACQGRSDQLVDVGDGLGNAFSAVFALVAVAKLERFEDTGGSAGRSRASADRTVCQMDLCLNGRIAAGVNDLTADYFFNL